MLHLNNTNAGLNYQKILIQTKTPIASVKAFYEYLKISIAPLVKIGFFHYMQEPILQATQDK